MNSLTSWPYAPIFCIGAAPTVPGIPLSVSRPAKPREIVVFTKSSQFSPAPIVRVAPLHASTSSSILLFEIRITVPAKPSSLTKIFVPPPIIKMGESPALSMAAIISFSLETSTKFLAGPPTRSEV